VISFRHILCPIDFSETSTRALTYAVAFAAWHEARLTVLHVTAGFDERFEAAAAPKAARLPAPGSRADIVDRLRASIEQSGAAALDVVPVAQEGRISESIVACAEAMTADLIVIGTHGRGGFHRLLLGSVTEKVVRTATRPVLTVPPGVTEITPGPVLFNRILCPIDYSPAALKALDYALDLGRQADGCVTVLAALEYMDPEDPLEPEPFDPCRQAVLDSHRRREHFVTRARERLHAQLSPESRTWCRIEEVVAIDRAYKAILQRASGVDVDLIVMGAQGSRGIELMLYGSNTHHVVRSAKCPVLTVRA
jgi:nucleotide-binding universal stress UspA family protein